jgi:hypothetical protein
VGMPATLGGVRPIQTGNRGYSVQQEVELMLSSEAAVRINKNRKAWRYSILRCFGRDEMEGEDREVTEV